ncbi:MAG TPA: penicillin-insensitive murein endopeptidase, partial [Cellvibrionaceae bacterium]|nr:penicillin-insensitive murein endopeptidase [Cellvibrionaceae bacterium]
MLRIFFLLYMIVFSLFVWGQTESECFGNPNNGSLKNGWQLPASGENFHAYSSIGALAGRNFVHSKVHRIVLEAYRILQETNPKIIYVYGETGFKSGGLFKPHKSHRNGLSVDFFVPVVDSKGVPAELPIGISNKLGYNLEFDSLGRSGGLSIDFESIAKHLDALFIAAKNQQSGIEVVIIDPRFRELLLATPAGAKINGKIRFS